MGKVKNKTKFYPTNYSWVRGINARLISRRLDKLLFIILFDEKLYKLAPTSRIYKVKIKSRQIRCELKTRVFKT